MQKTFLLKTYIEGTVHTTSGSCFNRAFKVKHKMVIFGNLYLNNYEIGSNCIKESIFLLRCAAIIFKDYR